MIRAIEQKDLNPLSELYVSVFKSHPWNEEWKISWAKERLDIIMASPRFSGFTFESESQILGAVLGTENSFKGKRQMEIVELFVAPHLQSTGIGSKLLLSIEEHAKRNGCFYSVLLTSNEVPAFGFYRHNGYIHSKEMAYLTHEL